MTPTPKEYPAGMELIRTGQCPIGAKTPMACMSCTFGRMTECHYPNDCVRANCSHYRRSADAERMQAESECT